MELRLLHGLPLVQLLYSICCCLFSPFPSPNCLLNQYLEHKKASPPPLHKVLLAKLLLMLNLLLRSRCQ